MWNTIIVYPFTNALLLIYTWVGSNFTLALVLLTVAVRVLLIPLTARQQKSQAKMQEMQPQIKAVQDKYKDNPEKMQKELLAIGYNPASMLGGCLPTLIQFPILIGMYQSILRAIPTTPLQMMDLYEAVYFNIFPNFADLIPVNSQFLWMDLSQPDRLFLDILPGIGIPILPILVVLTTILQQKVMMPPTAAGANDQSAQMQRSMMTVMPLMFGFFALQFASGLSIYFITANVISIFQFGYLNRERLEWNQLKLPGGLELPFPSFAPATAAATSKPTSRTNTNDKTPKSNSATQQPAKNSRKKRRNRRKKVRARKAGAKK